MANNCRNCEYGESCLAVFNPVGWSTPEERQTAAEQIIRSLVDQCPLEKLIEVRNGAGLQNKIPTGELRTPDHGKDRPQSLLRQATRRK